MSRKMNWPFTLIILSSVTASTEVHRRLRQPANYVLVWSDEFSTANGSLPDSSKWIMETGGGGWGNHGSSIRIGPNAHVQMATLSSRPTKKT
jgi:hypothetical protein